MSTKLTLGVDPGNLELVLSDGADFNATLRYKTGEPPVVTNWPTGTSLALVFSTGTSWSATISGALATWGVDKAVTATIPKQTKVSLVYTNGSTDRVLYMGTVKRSG